MYIDLEYSANHVRLTLLKRDSRVDPMELPQMKTVVLISIFFLNKMEMRTTENGNEDIFFSFAFCSERNGKENDCFYFRSRSFSFPVAPTDLL